MIDHITLPVSDMEKSKQFYQNVLAPLGYELLMDFGEVTLGFGKDAKPDFWLKAGSPGESVHVAFASDDRQGVEAFYTAALAAGAGDNGAPGVRPQYHPNYYGAFIFDPDGHNIEAVCHFPEAGIPG